MEVQSGMEGGKVGIGMVVVGMCGVCNHWRLLFKDLG